MIELKADESKFMEALNKARMEIMGRNQKSKSTKSRGERRHLMRLNNLDTIILSDGFGNVVRMIFHRRRNKHLIECFAPESIKIHKGSLKELTSGPESNNNSNHHSC